MKKLEDEYRQLIQSEVPDLWSRIEAEIDADYAGVTPVNNNEKKKAYGFWKKYSLPMAACVAVALCVPLMMNGFLGIARGRYESADTAAAGVEYAMENTSVTTDCAEEVEEAFVEESVADGTFVDESAEDGGVTEDCAKETEDLKEAISQESATEERLEKESEPVHFKLTINAVEASATSLENDAGEGIVYAVDTVEKGKCTLFVPAGADFDMSADVPFTVAAKPVDTGCYELVEVIE